MIHDHSAAAHAHAHPAPRDPQRAGASLLLLSGGARLSIAAGFAAASWALIFWAMA